MPPEILPTSVGGHLNENEAVDSDFMNRLFDKDDYYRGWWKINLKFFPRLIRKFIVFIILQTCCGTDTEVDVDLHIWTLRFRGINAKLISENIYNNYLGSILCQDYIFYLIGSVQ